MDLYKFIYSSYKIAICAGTVIENLNIFVILQNI